MKANVRRTIIYNPLRRSFLSEYLKYNETEKCLQASAELWKALTSDDPLEIKKAAESKLIEYYRKIKEK